MTCDRKRISAYLDGELTAEEAEKLVEHLASCEQCSADLERYRGLFESLSHLDSGRAPRDLRRAIYQQVETRARRSFLRSIIVPVVALGAAGLLGFGIALTLLAPKPSPPAVTAAYAVQEDPDSLDGLRIQIVFDRPIAPDSLRDGLTFSPDIPVVTRVVANRVELIPQGPLEPRARYRIQILNIRDDRGSLQEQPIVLTLRTSPTALLVQESTPRLLNGSAGWAVPVTASGPESGAPLGPLTLGGSLNPNDLVEGHPSLARALGSAISAPTIVSFCEQAFQGGSMLVREDTREVYALERTSGRWSLHISSWRPGEVMAPLPEDRPAGTLEPLRAVGKVWREQPAVRLELGWPVFEERSALGVLQLREHGLLARSAYGVLYALLKDGTWQVLAEPRR